MNKYGLAMLTCCVLFTCDVRYTQALIKEVANCVQEDLQMINFT